MNFSHFKHLVRWLPVLLIFLCSCTPSKYFKHYIYLSDTIKSSHLTVVPPQLHKLQKGDRIKVYVTSLDPVAAAQFAMPPAEPIQPTNTITRAEGVGYLVDNAGTIVFPQLGHVYVEGLTTDSVSALLEQKLSKYLTDPAVSVIFINFIVNIVGDMGRSGMINLQDGKNTIFDAIGMAGDLSTAGRRENILVVREKEGKREFGRIDISTKDVFNSPYYQSRWPF